MEKTKLKTWCVLAITLLCTNMATSQTFTWKKGSNSVALPIYGTLGVSNAANTPGAREASVTWKDASGNFWLFGGYGYDNSGNYDVLGDLWKYTPSNNQWTWIAGDSVYMQSGVYGTMGVPAASNKPGSRVASMGWADASGNLWMFGGLGMDGSASQGELNDLWKYNIATNQWTWMNGSVFSAQPATYGTIGVSAPTNTPGARYGGQGWVDASGNFWVFGGQGYDSSPFNSSFLSDLWRYTPSNNEWTWMHGNNTVDQPGVYGTMGTPANSNVPGGRLLHTGWADASGNLWLFGGLGLDNSPFNIDALNDLWKYNISSNQWTWVHGANAIDQPGVYGTMGTPAAANTPGSRYATVSWRDNTGNVWLFGGTGLDSTSFSFTDNMHDLWKYDPSSNQWTWMKGFAQQSQPGVYGTQGIGSPANIPGSRSLMMGWTDASNNLWMFGGSGIDAFNNSSDMNDLWKISMCTAQSLTVSSTNATVCAGTTVTLTVNGASTYTWSNTQTGSVIAVTPGTTTTYTVFSTDANGCSNGAIIQQSVNPNPSVSLTSSSNFTNCSGVSTTITATGATTYSWTSGQTTSVIVISPSATTNYTVEGIANGCNAFFPFSQTVISNPTVVLSSSSNTICKGASAIINVTGASSYSWHTNPGSSSSTLAVNPASTTAYSVTGTNSSGCKDTQSFTQVVDPCAGIEQNILNGADYVIYPNPSRGEFKIDGVKPGTKLVIVNSLGQKVVEKDLDNEDSIRTELSQGVYHYQLIQQGAKTASGKIVIE
jgi:N-acetylneuraminic acid mutarotase